MAQDNQPAAQARPIPWLRRNADRRAIDRRALFMDEPRGQAPQDAPFRKIIPCRPAPRGD